MASLLNGDMLNFNNTHSGNWVMSCVSDKFVGIDVEEIKNIDIKIANRFFHVDEYRIIMEAENRKKIFYDFWTKKESFIKAVGCGLSMSLGSFCVSNENNCAVLLDGKRQIILPENCSLMKIIVVQYVLKRRMILILVLML